MLLSYIIWPCLLLLSSAQRADDAPAAQDDASPATVLDPNGDPEAATNDDPNGQPGTLAKVDFKDIVKIVQCEGTLDQHAKCKCSQTVQWKCAAGSFCQTPSKATPCTPGFFCGANTFQPIYCCAGYYCPDAATMLPCPKGYYCKPGSIAPKRCWFGKCGDYAEGTTKYGLITLFAAFLVLVWLLFAIKGIRTRERNIRYGLRLQKLKEEHLGAQRSEKKQLARSKSQLETCKHTFDIRFEDLGLVLANGVAIMQKVSGEFKAGRSVAIMGSSGAGKSTFLSLLTGKVARTSGQIFINDKQEDLGKYRKLIGYVPQDDVMLTELTVRDVLMYSARTRLPASMSAKEKEQVALQTIDFLGLGAVMDTPIGNVAERGISGGQKKRVNIGLEMCAQPSILFLDEPTSGLDSSTSYELSKLLATIAREQQLTVAAIIHSPSKETFYEFNDLMLLGRGGRLVYLGPVIEAPEYFAKIGFPVPEGINPADHYMDVLSGKVAARIVEGYADCEYRCSDLPDIWIANRDTWRTQSVKERRHSDGSIMTVGSDEDMLMDEEEHVLMLSFGQRITKSLKDWRRAIAIAAGDVAGYWKSVFSELWDTIVSIFRTITFQSDPIRETPGYFAVYWYSLKRALLQSLRTPSGFVLNQVLHLGTGLFISIAASKSFFLGPLPDELCDVVPITLQARCRLPQSDTLCQVGQFMAWGIGFAGIAVGSGTFGNEIEVYWRERQAGIPALPYYNAKATVDILRAAIASLFFMGAFMIAYTNTMSFLELYAIIFLLYYVGFSSGYFISALFSRAIAPLAGVVFALIFATVLSGVEPSIRHVTATYGAGSIFWYLSAPRYGISAFYLKEVQRKSYQNISVGVKAYGYQDDTYAQDLLMMVGIGVA